MNLRLKFGYTLSLSLLAICFSCASKTPQNSKPVVEKESVESSPECIQGCMPNDEDQCVIEARVADGAVVEIEVVPCDPKCCEPGAKFIGGGGVDTDKDGIYDGADECVDQPEDYDSYRDKDGCPDPDNDNDKILDIDDQCPLDAEDVNGVDDEDGCPD